MSSSRQSFWVLNIMGAALCGGAIYMLMNREELRRERIAQRENFPKPPMRYRKPKSSSSSTTTTASNRDITNILHYY
jgi:hypothetical protein